MEETEVCYTPVGQTRVKQLTSWRHVYEFRPGKIAQKDYNFKKPTDGLVTDQTSRVSFEGSSNLEVYEYPGCYDESGKGDRLTKVRMEELEAEHDHVVGSGFYLNFAPGGKFDVDKHSRKAEEGRSYALVEVHTEFRSNLGFDSHGGDDFQNDFKCIPAETAFRPPRSTPKPIVEGPQTAIVTTDGQEIVVDEHARVKVQFHWDRYGQKDVNSSCWIRVSQVHAGKGWGMIDIPRQHEEVIVSFLNGDPDRPIITGRVYNGDNQPPFGLKGAGNNSKNKTRRGNSTKSYETDGFNEMTMDDTAGEEQIRIHAQYNMNTTVLNDQTLDVTNDRTNFIGNNESIEIINDQSVKVDNNQEIRVGVDQSTFVGGNYLLSVADFLDSECGASHSFVIGQDSEAMIGQNSSEQIGMKKEITAGTDVKISAGMKVTIEAGATVEFKCGASSIKLNPGMVVIQAPLVKIN